MAKLEPQYQCHHCSYTWQGWSKDDWGKDIHPPMCPSCLNKSYPYMNWINYSEFELYKNKS